MRVISLIAAASIAACVPGSHTRPANAEPERTIRCATLRYSIQVPTSWTVLMRCTDSMLLVSGADGIFATVGKLAAWSPEAGRAGVRRFLTADVPQIRRTSVVNGPSISIETIGGSLFVEGVEITSDGTRTEIDDRLEGFRQGRLYGLLRNHHHLGKRGRRSA